MKIKRLIIFLLNLALLIILFASCKSEISKEGFIIEGKIENYNGKIFLYRAAAPKYYPINFNKDSAMVINGSFQFELSAEAKNPLPYLLITENNIRTERFILEAKNQKIIIDSLTYKTRPRIVCNNSDIYIDNNNFYKRTKLFYDKFYYSIDSVKNTNTSKKYYSKIFTNESEKLTHSTNKILEDFTKENPNSFFAFWEIVIRHMYQGYSKEIEDSYNNLSKSIKESKVAELFYEDLIRTKSLISGNLFPKINLKNKDLKNVIFNVSDHFGSKYILIDFWFTSCVPCIRQFPKLKELYKKFHPKGLEIIGISTDRTKDIYRWNIAIEKNKINWKNLLDENTVESSRLSINSFPTNFLLNSEGIILKKNVSLDELELLLNE